jgi:hypothetical protein
LHINIISLVSQVRHFARRTRVDGSLMCNSIGVYRHVFYSSNTRVWNTKNAIFNLMDSPCPPPAALNDTVR